MNNENSQKIQNSKLLSWNILRKHGLLRVRFSDFPK